MKDFEITNGERWMLFRRRLNESQVQAADRLGMSLRSYTLLENGSLDAKPPILKNIQKNEIAWLYRKRAKMKQYEVAAEISLCREMVHQMEFGVIEGDRLFEYWGI